MECLELIARASGITEVLLMQVLIRSVLLALLVCGWVGFVAGGIHLANLHGQRRRRQRAVKRAPVVAGAQ